jgi:hypothetical protein
MKIREIIDLTKQGKNISQIAKEHLPCGEKKAREILVSIGAEKPVSGSRSGWDYGIIGADVLEKDISEFITKKATAKSRQTRTQKVSKKENRDSKNTGNNSIIKSTKEESEENIIYTENNPTNKKLKKVTYEIEEWLHDELRVKSIREKRKVSEIVNELIKSSLS